MIADTLPNDCQPPQVFILTTLCRNELRGIFKWPAVQDMVRRLGVPAITPRTNMPETLDAQLDLQIVPESQFQQIIDIGKMFFVKLAIFGFHLEKRTVQPYAAKIRPVIS